MSCIPAMCKAEFSVAINPVFGFTWSFRNHFDVDLVHKKLNYSKSYVFYNAKFEKYSDEQILQKKNTLKNVCE